MEALEAIMEKQTIHIDTSSHSSLGYALSTYAYAFNLSFSSSSHVWNIDFGASYHMASKKSMHSYLSYCNNKQFVVGDDRSLSVVGSRTIRLDND